MATILDEIVAYKREFLDNVKRTRNLAEVKSRLSEAPPVVLEFQHA